MWTEPVWMWLEKRKHRSDNSSGFQGVSKTGNGKYRVSIGFQGKRYYLGTYEKLQDAVEVRRSAEQTLHESFVRDFHRWEEIAENDKEWADAHPFAFHVNISEWKLPGTEQYGSRTGCSKEGVSFARKC